MDPIVSLAGRTLIVTGAGQGIGKAIAELGIALGANVVAVDKAPLDPKIAALPGVTIRAESAFGLKPSDVGAVDWLFSDVICYPARLLALVRRWLEAGRARNFCCTIKFQGETDVAAQAAFAAIPGAQVFHLHQNKHELTFARLVD